MLIFLLKILFPLTDGRSPMRSEFKRICSPLLNSGPCTTPRFIHLLHDGCFRIPAHAPPLSNSKPGAWENYAWHSLIPTSEINPLSSIRSIAVICESLRGIGLTKVGRPRHLNSVHCAIGNTMRFPEFSVNHLHSLWRFTTTTYSSMWRHDFHILRTYNLSSRSIVTSLEPEDYDTQFVLILKFSMRWEMGKLETGDITVIVVYVRPNILPRSLTILRKTNSLRSHRDKIPLLLLASIGCG
jgi:hypothetical protein